MSVRSLLSPAAAVVLILGACQADDADPAAREAADGASADAGVLQITARDFEFEAPDRIPAGWTTIRFENTGEEEHFVYLYRLPDDLTFQEFRTEAMSAFGRVWNAYDAGELTRSEAEAAFAEELPAWFFTDLTPVGGVALTEPGETARSTVRLEPGSYVIECYVKTPQGTYHTERGMQVLLEVGPEANGLSEPEADVRLTLSNYQIQMAGEPSTGVNTFAVHVEEDPEGFMMHDVNLVRLEGDTDLDEVVAWMDWMDLEQFRAPAPGHSLGGMEHMAAGRTGYVTVDLTPGQYAWVSEGYGPRGMVATFSVE